MQTKRRKVFTIVAKSPILNVLLSSEYGYSANNIIGFKRNNTTSYFLKVLQILENYFPFSCKWFPFSFITLTKDFFQLIHFHDRFQEGFKRNNF